MDGEKSFEGACLPPEYEEYKRGLYDRKQAAQLEETPEEAGLTDGAPTGAALVMQPSLDAVAKETSGAPHDGVVQEPRTAEAGESPQAPPREGPTVSGGFSSAVDCLLSEPSAGRLEPITQPPDSSTQLPPSAEDLVCGTLDSGDWWTAPEQDSAAEPAAGEGLRFGSSPPASLAGVGLQQQLLREEGPSGQAEAAAPEDAQQRNAAQINADGAAEAHEERAGGAAAPHEEGAEGGPGPGAEEGGGGGGAGSLPQAAPELERLPPGTAGREDPVDPEEVFQLGISAAAATSSEAPAVGLLEEVPIRSLRSLKSLRSQRLGSRRPAPRSAAAGGAEAQQGGGRPLGRSAIEEVVEGLLTSPGKPEEYPCYLGGKALVQGGALPSVPPLGALGTGGPGRCEWPAPADRREGAARLQGQKRRAAEQGVRRPFLPGRGGGSSSYDFREHEHDPAATSAPSPPAAPPPGPAEQSELSRLGQLYSDDAGSEAEDADARGDPMVGEMETVPDGPIPTVPRLVAYFETQVVQASGSPFLGRGQGAGTEEGGAVEQGTSESPSQPETGLPEPGGTDVPGGEAAAAPAAAAASPAGSKSRGPRLPPVRDGGSESQHNSERGASHAKPPDMGASESAHAAWQEERDKLLAIASSKQEMESGHVQLFRPSFRNVLESLSVLEEGEQDLIDIVYGAGCDLPLVGRSGLLG